jgi:hypothetical protein
MPRLGRGRADDVKIITLRPGFSRRVYAIWRSLAAERPAVAAVVAELRDVAVELSST